MKKILYYIKNKYIIVILVFIVTIVFVDDNNLAMSFQLRSQLKSLEYKKQYYLHEITTDSLNTVQLRKDIRKAEQYGREEYFMKRKNEDIFIIQKSE